MRSTSLLFALALIAVPSVALADIPPPDDYVETCTIDKQQVPGLECKSCSAWHGEQDACDKTLGAEGYRRMCKSYGASAWSEIWCKGEPTGPAPAEGPTPTSGPESKKTGCTGGGVAGLWALAAFGLLRARRRALSSL